MSVDKREKGIYKVTLIGSVVNMALLVFKFVAGIVGNSAAMIADAVHSLSDFVTDIIVLLFVRVSSKPKDKEHEYGHGKYETLATLVIGVVLLIVGVGIAYNAVENIIAIFRGEDIKSPGLVALIAAIVSIVLKEWLYRYTVSEGRKLNSQAVIANAWHHRSDAFSSIGTAIGVGGSFLLGDKWVVLDPIAAVVVSVFIVKASFSLIVPSINELVEEALPPEIEKEILDIAASVPEVIEPHDLHTRRIGNQYAIEMHVLIDGSMSLHEAHDIASQIEERIKDKFGKDTHIIVHPEPYDQH